VAVVATAAAGFNELYFVGTHYSVPSIVDCVTSLEAGNVMGECPACHHVLSSTPGEL